MVYSFCYKNARKMIEQAHSQQPLTVSELSTLLKQTIEGAFGRVRLRGEVSGAKMHTSGHLYFRLKDAEAVIDAVAWRGSQAKWPLRLADGMDVVCFGRLTTYPGASRYQIVVETVELAGQGALLQLLEERKRKLIAEGLFDPARKQLLPFLPQRIGVVTSPTGAVLRDILHRIKDRFPCHVLLWPVAVQGQGAAEQIAAAIDGFALCTPRPDVLILARGGGSLEDLWAFNEECVVRAMARCPIPTISAVGHETDTTLADFAADRRAPTPTAAAEMAVPVLLDLIALVAQEGAQLRRTFSAYVDRRFQETQVGGNRLKIALRLVEEKMLRLGDWAERLPLALSQHMGRAHQALSLRAGRLLHPRQLVLKLAQEVQLLAHQLSTALREHVLTQGAHQVGLLGSLLESLSHKRVLERGYAHVRALSGATLSTQSACLKEPQITVNFHDGGVAARVLNPPTGGEPSRGRGVKNLTGQGELF